MRRRLVAILAFPIIVSFFLVGWVLYYRGTKQEISKNAPSIKSTVMKKQPEYAANEGIEMGLVEEEITMQYTG